MDAEDRMDIAMAPENGKELKRTLSRLVRSLGDFCREHVLDEKWLIAPSLRVGFQWLEQVARSGQPVLNVRVKTLGHMALELASPEMVRRKATYLRGARAQVLIGRMFGRLGETGRSGYLATLKASPGLIRCFLGALRDLRLAGLTGEDLAEASFEVQEKGREIRSLLIEYEKELGVSRLLDDADILRISAERLKKDPDGVPEGAYVLLPEDARSNLRALEQRLWESVPDAMRVLLDVDRPGQPPAEDPLTDLALLGWVLTPAEAPLPAQDNTVSIFHAVGEVNEVHEVLRRCVEQKIPFDEVEILHTDSATYVPLVYELAWRLAPEGTDSVPVTFAEGIPPGYSRPARALRAWLAWIREDYPQAILVRMIQDGLLKVDGARLGEDAEGKGEAGSASFTKLGAILRTVPVGGGRDRYLEVLGREIAALEAPLARKSSGLPEEDEDREAETETGSNRDMARLQERLGALRLLRVLARDLLACAVAGHGRSQSQKKFLEAALEFLEKQVRRVGKLDEYAHAQLVQEIRELADCLGQEEVPDLDVREWLAELTRSSHVLGLGPRPGCLHVAPLSMGGHSGRKHTFILGLDDTRFPGAGLQDALLLDGERGRISPDLPTAGGRLARTLEGFAGLLSRLRGSVTLSYCCRSLSDDRDMFPSSVVLSVYRIVSGNREGDQETLLRWLPDPASFAPDRPGRSIDRTEWWLWRMCAGGSPENPEEVVARHFPHLGRGFRAAQARESDRFTEYDGYVPQAGLDLDPTGPDGPVLSASRLEKLGACPMEFFFQYVLGIEPLEEYRIDPKVWLQPADKGRLLHEVFREFMGRLNKEKFLPEFSRDIGLIEEILEQEIAQWRKQLPPPNREVFVREVSELRQAARIFLMEEEAFCKESRPLCFEASVGLPPEGEGTILDSPEPVEIRLPGGKTIRARGRIDRVDAVPGSETKRFTVWDYKTGSTWRFTEKGRKREDPFHQGRLVQSALYLALAEARLRETVSPGASVSRFGYFFPAVSAHGERIQWEARELAAGGNVIARLCEMIAKGCFPCTDDGGDVRFSDFQEAFGLLDRAARAVRRKLENLQNEALSPFRDLRGGGREGREEAEE